LGLLLPITHYNLFTSFFKDFLEIIFTYEYSCQVNRLSRWKFKTSYIINFIWASWCSILYIINNQLTYGSKFQYISFVPWILQYQNKFHENVGFSWNHFHSFWNTKFNVHVLKTLTILFYFYLWYWLHQEIHETISIWKGTKF
jgi:hypothetical protein